MLVSYVQMNICDAESRLDRMKSAERHLEKIYKSGNRPAQIIFPELWATGFFQFDNYRIEAERETGESFELMSEWARKIGAYIHSGSFVEKDGESYYNTSLLIDPRGQIVAKYRKMHLFGYQSREAKILKAGNASKVVDTEYGKVGLGTCYDLRFPELFRMMSGQGAEIFLITAAWPTGRIEHWRALNQARAIENQCIVIACNGVGCTKGVQLGGNSMIIDAQGKVLKCADDEEIISLQEVYVQEVREYRSIFPVLQDKKIEVCL